MVSKQLIVKQDVHAVLGKHAPVWEDNIKL